MIRSINSVRAHATACGESGLRGFAFGFLAIAVLSSVAGSPASPAAAEELVKFDAARPLQEVKVRSLEPTMKSKHTLNGTMAVLDPKARRPPSLAAFDPSPSRSENPAGVGALRHH
jgi:hypothetical protein